MTAPFALELCKSRQYINRMTTDVNDAAGSPAPEPLPTWDLEKTFYPASLDADPAIQKQKIAAQIKADIAESDRLCTEFRRRYHDETRIATLPDDGIKEAIDSLITSDKLATRASDYTFLQYQRSMLDTDAELAYLEVYRDSTRSSRKMDFILRDIAFLPDEVADRFNANPTVPPKYKYYVNYVRKDRKHMLGEEAEEIMNEMTDFSVANADEYEFLTSSRTFSHRGKEDYDYNSIANIALHSPDRAEREEAWKSMNETLGMDEITFAGYLNDALMYHEKQQRLRRYATRASAWNSADDVDDALPLNMTQAIHDSRIVPEFYELRAEMMGMDKLKPWDIMAPLPGTEEKQYSWGEAHEIIVKALTDFHPEMGKLAERAFEEHWIDAAPSVGKYFGAGFCIPGAQEYPPHVLVNWLGSTQDLITLAHEVSHAVAMHTHTAHQGKFLDETTMLEAEMTALMGEQIIFGELKKRAKTPLEQRAMQTELIDNSMFYMRRAYECELAQDLHAGYPSPTPYYNADDVNAKHVHYMKECYGNTIDKQAFETDLAPRWTTLYHQFSDPFYIGDYPLASLAVHRAWAEHEKAGADSTLPQKFWEMLKLGGTAEGPELILNGTGVDITRDHFLHEGIDAIRNETGVLREMWKKEQHIEKWRAQCTSPPGWAARHLPAASAAAGQQL